MTGPLWEAGAAAAICAGTTIRLAIKFNNAGASQFPEPMDPDLNALGMVFDTGTRTYQIWYRDSPVFCTSATYNLTNGLQVVWGL